MRRAVIWCAVSTKEQTKEDKFSLREQEADSRALCEREGWLILDVLRVPGHSRYYSDIHELAADARANGIDAFDRMLEHWRSCDFDILICKDGDRFARRQSLHAYFTERTLDSRAQIYSFSDGWIDEEKAEMWTAMNGYKAASHVKRLVKERADGMKDRMKRGLNGGNAIPEYYRIVRDERGRAIRLEFREDEYRRMVDDAADLLLDGVGWNAFPVEMYLRYGYANPKTGKPYHDNWFIRLFHSPYTWGITAMRYVYKLGLWAFDESESLPEGVIVNRKPDPPIPSIWTGETAELIKMELRRRAAVVQGRAKANSDHRFTGLLVCARCGWRMAIDTKKKWKSQERYFYWRCSAHTVRHIKLGGKCSNTKMIPDSVAQEQIDDFLSRYLAQGQPDLAPLLRIDSEESKHARRRDLLKVEITALQAQIDRVIIAQSTAPANVYDNYTRQIEQFSQRLTTLEGDLKRTEAQLEPPIVSRGRFQAYEQLSELRLERFWKLPAHEINQILHRVMGKHRFVVEEGLITDVR